MAIILALVVAGCGLFDPRDPVTKNAPTTCTPRTNPDSVVAIIQEVYGHSSELGCYTSALDPAFEFHADPQDSSEDSNPAFYANWGHDVEALDATNLAANALSCVAVLDSEYTASSTPDTRTEIRYYAYHVLFQSIIGSPVRYQGLADITFHQGPDNLWQITVWIDKRDASGSATWGRLRREYRSAP